MRTQQCLKSSDIPNLMRETVMKTHFNSTLPSGEKLPEKAVEKNEGSSHVRKS